jgi:hypothetical protein
MITQNDGSPIIAPWSYSAPASGLVNTTTAVTIKTAGGIGVKNYITDIQIFANALGAATEFCIRDGAGGPVLWRMGFPITALVGPLTLSFNSPIVGSSNTLLEIVTLTASVTGAIYFNAQGFTGK